MLLLFESRNRKRIYLHYPNFYNSMIASSSLSKCGQLTPSFTRTTSQPSIILVATPFRASCTPKRAELNKMVMRRSVTRAWEYGSHRFLSSSQNRPGPGNMKKALVPTNVKNAVLASFLGLFVVGVYYFSIKRMQGQVLVVDLSVLLTPIAECVCIMRFAGSARRTV